MPRNKVKQIQVEEFTSPSPYSVSSTAPLNDVRTLMATNKIRHVPVVDNDAVVGIISERDLNLAFSIDNATKLIAKDVMVEKPYTVDLATSLEEVAFKMSSEKIGSAIVHDGQGHVYGIFTSTDALNALIEVLRGEV